MKKNMWHFSISCSVFAIMVASANAKTANNLKYHPEDMLKLIQAQQVQLEKQDQKIRQLSEKIEGVGKGSTKTADSIAKEAMFPERPERVGVDRKPAEHGELPKVAAVQNEGGVLLAPGQMVFEPSLEYSRSSALRVAVEGFTIIPALNIGSFEISQVNRDTLAGVATGRIGVAKDFEMELRIPYVYRNDNTLSRPIGTGSSSNIFSDITGDGVGDVEIGSRYQITHGEGGYPFLIGGLRFKSRTGTDPFEVPIDLATGLETELPTGSGFYALQPTLTAIMPSDPVVLYGSLGYLYNMSRNVGGAFGEIDPGDSISFSFGMGFSANEKTSFSLGYSHSFVFATKRNGSSIANSDELHVGAFSTGLAYALNDKTSLNLNVEAGLTEDAPDVRVIFRVPMAVDF